MSRSVYADQVANLEVQLATALTEKNKLVDALDASKRETYAARQDAIKAQGERDAARQSVVTLKELLHNAELSASRVQGQLDRINQVEDVARTPMVKTIQESTAPADMRRPHRDYADGGYLRTTGITRDSDKHWTSL